MRLDEGGHPITDFILHIGDGKCGSSSIQRAMYAARVVLRAQGLIYETAAPNGTHFGLVTLVGRSTRGEAAAQKIQVSETIRMIREARRKDDRVVLSGESFFFLPHAKMMIILDQITGTIGALDVIAYVRQPHSQYLSLVQQTLKGDSTFSRPDAYRRPLDEALRQWRDGESVRQLVVRKFDRSRLYQGDVVQDFAQVIQGFSGKTIALEGKEANTSLSAEQMVALQRFRREVLPTQDGRLHPASGQLITFFQNMNRISLMGIKPALVPSALVAICAGNAAVVSNLNEMFPELQLELPAIGADQSGDDRWRSSGDVADILEGVDIGDVERLIALIPQLSPGLQNGMTPAAHAALQRYLLQDEPRRARQIIHVQRFWHNLNCDQAVRDLQTAQGH